VRWEADCLGLVAHRIWRPSKAEPMDLERTVEAFLLDLQQRFGVERVVFDPYQLHRSAATLKQAGLPVHEYAQTEANLTAAGQTFFELLKGRRLRVYPDAELRQQALNTTAVESPRGFRIAKQKASRKVDAIVALAMACRSAIEAESEREPVKRARVWGTEPRGRVVVGQRVVPGHPELNTLIYADELDGHPDTFRWALREGRIRVGGW
jgi:hypothetical protein